MIEIKDELFLGIIAGVAGNLVTGIFGYIFYLLGFAPYLRWHIAASLFFPETLIKTLPAIIIGIFADYTVAILLGVILTYIYRQTGFDYSLVKGVSLGLLSWLIGVGLIVSNIDHLIQPEANTQLILLTDHIILGVSMAWFIGKLSPDIKE